MRTIIHIGQHKTGTTSLQHFLFNNRQAFEKVGLYYPNVICGFENPSHFILNIYSLNKYRYSPMKEKFLEKKHPEFFANLNKNLEYDIKKHYQEAIQNKCNDIVWSNEGLYLLNSLEEYNRLLDLFAKHSSEVVCVCSFRDIETYRMSYIQELKKHNLSPKYDKDSYRYIEVDSWLFDYERKKLILNQVFDKTIFLSYNKQDMIQTFMSALGYKISNTENIRLNVS